MAGRLSARTCHTDGARVSQSRHACGRPSPFFFNTFSPLRIHPLERGRWEGPRARPEHESTTQGATPMAADAEQRDEDLMALVADGRADLLEKLIRRHSVGLLTFLTRMVGDAHKAEELFQDAFMAVWLKRHRYEYPRPFRPWLYAIALNRCRASFRVRSLVTAALGDDDQAPDREPAPDRPLMNAETARLVSRAVTQLPERQRAVVSLRVWEDLPYSRIAEVLGCTEGTVRSHMHHGLNALRELLQPLINTGAIAPE